MTPAQFALLRAIVAEALDLPREERASLLERRCSLDPRLHQFASALLEQDDGTDAAAVLANEAPVTVHLLAQAGGDDDPRRIGRYRILRRIGAGGMGIVYLGVDPDLGREVAIKALPAPLALQGPAVERFRREARILAQLQHPNIATIHTLETVDERVFLTMEHVRGESLADWLARGPIPVATLLPIARQIACALEAAHASGVVHRDVKPANVLVTRDGGVKVLDFGIARLLSDPQEGDEGGAPIGTPGYMAPEQIRGVAVGVSADLWSFGCVLHECLTGEPAFGGSVRERLRAAQGGDYDGRALPGDAPADLRDLVRGLLTRDPAGRPESALAVRRVLDGLLEGLAHGVHAGSAHEPLPRYRTRFVGRHEEREGVVRLLGAHPLVTVTGPGGCGKTRLAIEAAGALAARDGTTPEHNVRFVDLASVRDPESLALRVGAALGLDEAPGDVTPRIVSSLRRAASVLLVLDNCEPILGACADLARLLLARCEGLRILATSREPLGIDGESVLRIDPLPVEDAGERQQEDEGAVALFIDRGGTDGDTAAIREICRRLDGLPLAIELAASWCGVLSPGEILERLHRRLDLPAPRAAAHGERHGGGLRAMLDSSYATLAPGEQALFRKLAVFRGGCTLEAIEQVCFDDRARGWQALDSVRSLLMKSLLDRHRVMGVGSAPRYRMLETIREYAEERLRESGEEAAARASHFAYYATLFARGVLRGEEQALWIARYREEDENVRAALEGRGNGDALLAAPLVATLVEFWIQLGRWREGRRITGPLLEALRGGPPSAAFVEVARGAAEMARLQGDLAPALDLAEEALAGAESLGDSILLTRCRSELARIAIFRGETGRAHELLDACVEDGASLDDPWLAAVVRFNRGLALGVMEDMRGAAAEFRESLNSARRVGDRRGIANCLNALGRCLMNDGSRDEARAVLEESLAMKRAADDRPAIVTTLLNLGMLENDAFDPHEGDVAGLHRARAAFEEARSLAREMEDHPNVARILVVLGYTAILSGETEEARRLFEESLSVACDRRGFDAAARIGLGHVDLREGTLDAALAHGSAGLDIARAERARNVEARAHELLAEIHAARRDLREAVAHLARAARLVEAAPIQRPVWIVRAVRSLEDDLRGALGEAAYREVWEGAGEP